MKNDWLIRKDVGNYIGLITRCLDGIHPEFSMLTDNEFYYNDRIFLSEIVKSILNGDMRYYDHYLFFGGQENKKDISAFIIVDPGDDTRFRVVKTMRAYYSDSLKILI